jgi:glycosyltransferase involved in cell wall biosynthesis
MRILHIWDQAGVACILAKYQSRQGHSASVLRIKGQDKYGINRFYEEFVIYSSQEDFIQRSLKEAEAAQLIHIHSRLDVLFPLREKFGKSKKIILHYHGTDIRGLVSSKENSPKSSGEISRFPYVFPQTKSFLRRILRRKSSSYKIHMKAQTTADAVLVSTPDLLSLAEGATYLPNPIDTEHFKPDEIPRNDRKRALTIDTEATDVRRTLKYCNSHNIDTEIEVYDRTQKPVMYGKMPNFLKGYDIYVDVRYVNGRILENLSKTALESLACGLEVLDHRLEYRRGLPTEYKPSSVLSKISNFYSQ